MLQLTAIGHLGQDAELRNFNGQNVINFSVPHSKKYEKAGQQMQETIWIQCSRWTESTGILPYLKKGQLVCVIGEPSVRTYKNSQGVVCAQMQMKVSHIELLGGRKEDPSAAASTAVAQPAAAPELPSEIADDLPF